MKSVGYGAGGFAKFVACYSSCKFEKLLAVGGDNATSVVEVVFVVATVIWPNSFVGTVVAIFFILSRDWIRASVSDCEAIIYKNIKMRYHLASS